jgi:23S rRNA (guanine2445-N2)-methyltransferase
VTRLYATCALGTADLVARELGALGFGARWDAGGARFEVPAGQELVAGMRACLHLRAALRVLWPLASFPVSALGDAAAAVPWEDFLRPATRFAVAAVTAAPPPHAHGPYLAQRLKDAVVDRLRARAGARPDVDRRDPDVRLYLHVAGDGSASCGLDVSGDSLHLRGYRVAQTPAPLRETLAAAVLLAAAPDPARPLADPMCGSGTLALEAALLACRIPPGLATGRPRRFGFHRWPSFGDAERAAWDRLVEEARAQILPRPPARIRASDRDPEAVAAARRNAAACAAPVREAVELEVADVRGLAPMDPPGVIVSNPPYGARLETGDPFFRALGTRLRALDGHTGFLLLPSLRLLSPLGLRPTWQRRLKNGPLDVWLCRFELGRQRRRRG